ncbi:SEC-C metal-binding domain-containing protein [Bacillus sp. SS-TM]
MKIRRNEVCHCGSGKKYKKCYLNVHIRDSGYKHISVAFTYIVTETFTV